MKKIIHTFLLIFMLLALPQAVMAANGDIVGNIYSTDIKANINGVWVDSYCIDGKTVVVIEDITSNYRYYDDIRTLTCDRFDKDDLKPGKNTTAQTPGKIIGKIYETDIKTFIGGQHVPCYALNGKMAVAIEDLGNDGEFSDIGGKYIWNADERTITLELAYNNLPFDILEEKHLNLKINYDTLTADFERTPMVYGMSASGNAKLENRADITYKGEVICRTFKCEKIGVYNNNGVHTLADAGVERIMYYDIDKINELTSDIEPAQLTYQDWLDFFKYNTPCSERERFETDDYIFIYMHFSNRHGGTEGLIKLDKHDGTRIDFDENFESVSLGGQKYFEDVVIDRENEKVYFHYDLDYVIDLKTDKIKTIEPDSVTLTDFIGIEPGEIERITIYSPKTGTEVECGGIEWFLGITDCVAVTKNDAPDIIDASGLYITIYKTDSTVKNIYISADGGVDECRAHSDYVPQSKHIIKNVKRLEKIFEMVRPRTYATNQN